MRIKEGHIKEFVLDPGEYYSTDQPAIISTLLGSCVSACLYDPVNKVIGMNHFLLGNKSNKTKGGVTTADGGRYGVHAMELVVNGMLALGAEHKYIKAKAFGGGNVLQFNRSDASFLSIGETNITFIKHYLKTEKIPLVISDLGRDYGREIKFSSHDCSVSVRRIISSKSNELGHRDKKYYEKTVRQRKKASTDIELWGESKNMYNTATLQKKDFYRLSDFIHKEYGIKMPEVKKTLLESRLQKRLRLLGIDKFNAYCDYLFSPDGLSNEIPHFIDMITTNKTDFFRESNHFNFLVETVLPHIINTQKNGSKNLNIWSAGCSTGEEPYTLAMVVNDFLAQHPGLRMPYSILGTDISIDALKTAQQATYNEIRVEPVPLNMKRKYLLKSKNRDQSMVRIAPELRKQVQFGLLNLMDSNFGLKKQMDVVFCRNVIIYFDKETQEDILSKILRNLVPGGYFFQGHSETTQGMKLPLKQIIPTVYQKI